MPIPDDIIAELTKDTYDNWIKFMATLAIEITRNPFGKCYIIFGNIRKYKSTTVRILGHVLGGASIWPGSEFIKQNDVLKWDSYARSGNKALIIEEMKWHDPIKKITIRDTLIKIKELFTGDGLDMRLSKSNKDQCSDIKVQISALFITSNEYTSCNYKIIQELVESDISLGRRISNIHVRDQYNISDEFQASWDHLINKYTQEKLELFVSKYINCLLI